MYIIIWKYMNNDVWNGALLVFAGAGKREGVIGFKPLTSFEGNLD